MSVATVEILTCSCTRIALFLHYFSVMQYCSSSWAENYSCLFMSLSIAIMAQPVKRRLFRFSYPLLTVSYLHLHIPNHFSTVCSYFSESTGVTLMTDRY